MQVSFVTPDSVTDYTEPDIPALLSRKDGFLWLDVVDWEPGLSALLKNTFHVHSLVLEACQRRNHVPDVHTYAEHVFIVLHVPLAGRAGHVHMLELDQIVGHNYLVTVHGPRNPVVSEDEATRETVAVRYRVNSGRFHPTSPWQLSYSIGSAMARRQRELVSLVAARLPDLEKEVMSADLTKPEILLERLFLLRHELIIGRTMASGCYDMYARLDSLDRNITAEEHRYARDLSYQFERVRSVADGERDFLYGVIELYETRVQTRMTVAMERLAVIAAITLPITALASVYGMNVIVNDETHVGQLIGVIAVMLAISGVLLRWTKRQGWW